jgi:ribosomal protein S18 acetylase RimI-like enzyme
MSIKKALTNFISSFAKSYLPDMIRKSFPQDEEFFYLLYMHPQVNPYLLYEEMELEAFTPIYQELTSKQVLYVFEANETRAGMCKLLPLTYRCSHILYIGGLAIHPDFTGKGLGIHLMNDILEHARQEGFKRLELSVASHNTRAIGLYQKSGFQQEGVLRNYTYLRSRNQYLDEVMMSCLL